MTITEISKKYSISEAYLNAKDDALSIAAASLIDLKNMLEQNHPKQAIADKMKFLSDFLYDVKNSTH
jgi:2C-methyl-D-erythritol 2,4-cyclodiphosphate synthase